MYNNEFDQKAREWDADPMHRERAGAVAKSLLNAVPVNPAMKALEYGAGTGLLSFILADNFSEITLMDNSPEMVKVMQEKITQSKRKSMKPLLFNLEESEYYARKFDIIYNLLVLHHVTDIEALLKKFYQLLNPGGFLAIADLYPEDGSFHRAGFTGHNGFDVNELQSKLGKIGFRHHYTGQCYLIKKLIEDEIREYPVFMLVGLK
jgi:ubiquinone/menaquinone biosynthesis C-methylase UbiE